MSGRWISEERVIELERMGRLRDVNRRETAREWNGNIEPVKLCREGGVVNQPAPGRNSPSLPRSAATSSAAPLTLPWPPSGNTAVRHATRNGETVHYLRPEVTAYRAEVALLLCRSDRISGQYVLHVEMSPPDARRRDIDNALKSSLDALVQAKYLPDDSMAYMRELHVIVNDDRRGDIRVRAEPIEREAA